MNRKQRLEEQYKREAEERRKNFGPDTLVENTDVSIRAKLRLRGFTLGALALLSDEEFRALPNVSGKDLYEIRQLQGDLDGP